VVKTKQPKIDPSDIPAGLPTVIRGCMFDDGWEFDAPCIVYYPFFKYSEGGNTSGIDAAVEEVCIDLAIEDKSPSYLAIAKDLAEECEWRGWSMKGFARRKDAWHVEFNLEWFRDRKGDLMFKILSRIERRGPFTKARKLKH